MLHPAWIEREAPLPRCPLARCRRSATCHHSTDDNPCRRLHETKDAMRMALAAKLRRLCKEAEARDPEGKNYAPPGSPEQLRRIKIIYDMVRAADEANSANEMAKLAARKKPKPARARDGA